jgi:hypothetical protein
VLAAAVTIMDLNAPDGQGGGDIVIKEGEVQ